MAYQQAKFRESASNISSHFALFPGDKVKVQSVLCKFDATQVEVELDPAESGEFTVLDADENGYSMQSFRPASELTYTILAKSSIGELAVEKKFPLFQYMPMLNPLSHSI